MKLWRSKCFRGNCLWAVKQRIRRGGHIRTRKADLAGGIFPHFMWEPTHGKHIYHYRPIDRSVRWPWPWTPGYIQRHEDEVYQKLRNLLK